MWLIKFACNAYLEPKKLPGMINKRQFCAARLGWKLQIMLAVFFFGKYFKIMLVMTNYAKNDASIIYKSLRSSGYRFLETIALQATCR